MKRPRLRQLHDILFNRKSAKEGKNDVTPQQGVIAVGVSVILVLWIMTIGWIIHSREAALLDAGRELATLDQILTADTVRIFDATDLVLDGIMRDLADLRVTSASALRAMTKSPIIHRMLADRAEQANHVGTLTIVSNYGDLLAYSRDAEVPPINVVDREYFQQMLANPSVRFALGSPISSRFSGDLSIHYARPLIGEKDEMIGAVVAIMPLSYFVSLYESLQVGSGGAISLWRDDGTMLARYPSFPGAGQKFRLDMFRKIVPNSQPQIYETENSLGGMEGVPRIIAAQQSDRYPIIVNVSFDRNMVLRTWGSSAVTVVIIVFLLTCLTGLTIWEILRRLRVSYELGVSRKRFEAEVGRREEVEDQLRQSQKLEAVGQLTAGIAHDFNNILTVVIGHIDVVRRGVGPNATPMVTKSIDRASTAARKAADLTHRLLAFARKQRLDPASIQVEDLLEEMTSILGRTLGEHVKIAFERAGDVWPVFADRNQLENVLVNLAINSRDAMETGGTLSLTVRNTHIPSRAVGNDYDGMTGDFVAISVIDTGSGMSSEVLERAFEPFFSTKGIGRGSGLGLSQVYGFSKQSGGSAIIESEMGVGTTVTVYLPRSADVEIPVELVPASDYPLGAREIILVVDDNDDLREFAITALSELNYRVLHAEDASEALTILRTSKVDVLLADIGLPGMSGPELGKEAKKNWPGLEVIYMTGYALDEIDKNGVAPERVMLKPFTYRIVAEKLRDILAERKIRQAVEVR